MLPIKWKSVGETGHSCHTTKLRKKKTDKYVGVGGGGGNQCQGLASAAVVLTACAG